MIRTTIGKTIRTATLAVAVAVPVALAAAPALAQTADPAAAVPTLKREAIVTGEIVRIGDLVDNAGRAAAVAVFRAPDLGQSGAVAAARVIDAVAAHGVTVAEAGDVAEVVVVRATRTFTMRDIEARVARAIAARTGIADAADVAVTLDRETRPLHLDPAMARDLAIVRLAGDPRSGRFDVTFELPAAGGRPQVVRYTGTVQETVSVAVPARSLGRGDVIRRSDVVIARRPKVGQVADLVGNPEQAIGSAVRRPIAAGEPIRTADLMRPEIVVRNEAVTLVFEIPGIVISLRGKALESGAEGDLVNVVNLQSKRTVQGVVTGPGRVTVSRPGAGESTLPARRVAAGPAVGTPSSSARTE